MSIRSKGTKQKTLPALEAGFVLQSLLLCQWPTRQIGVFVLLFFPPCDKCFSCSRKGNVSSVVWFEKWKASCTYPFLLQIYFKAHILQVSSALNYLEAVLQDKKRSGLLKSGYNQILTKHFVRLPVYSRTWNTQDITCILPF